MDFNRPRTRLQRETALVRAYRGRKDKEKNESRGNYKLSSDDSSKLNSLGNFSEENDLAYDNNNCKWGKNERGVRRNNNDDDFTISYNLEISSEEDAVRWKKIGKKETLAKKNSTKLCSVESYSKENTVESRLVGRKLKKFGGNETGEMSSFRKKPKYSERKKKNPNYVSEDDIEIIDLREDEEIIKEESVEDNESKVCSMTLKHHLKRSVPANRVNQLGVNNVEKNEARRSDKNRKGFLKSHNNRGKTVAKKNVAKTSVDDTDESDYDDDEVKIIGLSNDPSDFALPTQKRDKSVISKKEKKIEETVSDNESFEELSESEDESSDNESSDSANSSDSLYRQERESLSSDEVASSDDDDDDDKDCKPHEPFVVSHDSSDEEDDRACHDTKDDIKDVCEDIEGENKGKSKVEGVAKKVRKVSHSVTKILVDSICDDTKDDIKDVCEDIEGENKGKSKVEGVVKKVRKVSHSVTKILVDSIWEKGGAQLGELFSSKESPTDEAELLPLKFNGFSDSEEDIPEKSEWDIEAEELLGQMYYVMGLHELGTSDDAGMVDSENNIPSKGPSSCCLNGGNHRLILDEQIGFKCTVCNFVTQEIRDIAPEFAKHQGGRARERTYNRAERSNIGMVHIEDFSSTKLPNFENYVLAEGTVWDLVPGIWNSMYPHQREGFEFIWKNIADSIFIDKAKQCISGGGGSGCLISHAPGTGKTRLTIMFLQTYMQLNSNCHPLIIAPCNLLHTWEQEFKKWKVGIPFHNLNNSKLSGLECAKAVVKKGQGLSLETSRLVKLLSWMSKKSVIGISYQLFEELAYEKNKEVQDDDVAGQIRNMLLMLPGLLVLDECHIPRNQESQIWKALLELQTTKRIMLSGTPFQNNFEELLNTLCLARPKFSNQIMSQIPGKSTETQSGITNEVKRKWASMTNDISKHDHRQLKDLKEMISGFVHVYKGSILKEKLPGLNDCVVVLSPTNLQNNIMEVVKSRKSSFDLDHLRSLISVHPSLYLSVSLSENEKNNIRRFELEKLRLNPNEGVKTRFVVQLVKLSVALKERVLVFSQYLDSLKLILEQLSNLFQWKKGKEIMIMIGEHSEKQRRLSINQLNNPESEVRVLLASTKACSEGINLIGASRVVLLDVMWNPSITRQSISRAYRLGQEKVVFVYHLIDETWEGAKYIKQAEKNRIADLIFSSKDGENKPENSCALGEDKILQDMVQHPNMKSIFRKIIYQPKEQDFIDMFG